MALALFVVNEARKGTLEPEGAVEAVVWAALAVTAAVLSYRLTEMACAWILGAL